MELDASVTTSFKLMTFFKFIIAAFRTSFSMSWWLCSNLLFVKAFRVNDVILHGICYRDKVCQIICRVTLRITLLIPTSVPSKLPIKDTMFKRSHCHHSSIAGRQTCKRPLKDRPGLRICSSVPPLQSCYQTTGLQQRIGGCWHTSLSTFPRNTICPCDNLYMSTICDSPREKR